MFSQNPTGVCRNESEMFAVRAIANDQILLRNMISAESIRKFHFMYAFPYLGHKCKTRNHTHNHRVSLLYVGSVFVI